MYKSLFFTCRLVSCICKNIWESVNICMCVHINKCANVVNNKCLLCFKCMCALRTYT